MLNAIDAMKGVDGTRELATGSQLDGEDQLTVSVSDTGVGFVPTMQLKSSNRSLPPKFMGLGWGYQLAAHC